MYLIQESRFISSCLIFIINYPLFQETIYILKGLLTSRRKLNLVLNFHVSVTDSCRRSNRLLLYVSLIYFLFTHYCVGNILKQRPNP